MNSVTRVFSAIRHARKGPVPRGELVLDPGFVTRYLHWRGSGCDIERLSPVQGAIACARNLKLDIICLLSERSSRPEPVQTAIADIQPVAEQGFFVFWLVNGAFQSMMQQLGTIAFLTDVAREPEKVGKRLRRFSDRVVTAITHGVDAGVHGVMIADDIAFGRSTYTSPAFIERYLLPEWRRQTAAASGFEVPVFLHSDGCLTAVLPHIVAAGFDGLQCIEPAAGMDCRKIREKVGRNFCLMGNIDPALLAKPAESSESGKDGRRLEHAVKDLLAFADEDSGFIFGTCSGLHAGMSPERVQRMYDIVTANDGKSSDKEY